MKFQRVFCAFLFISVISCKNPSGTPVAQPQEFDVEKYSDTLNASKPHLAKKDSVLPKPDSTAKEEFVSPADTIKLKIKNGKAVIDTLKTPRQKLVFLFDSDTANRFSVKISTQDSIANLRINQVIDEKGNADGPFGRELNYSVLEKGLHKIIISENQMAGTPWGGTVRFEIKLFW